MIATPSPYWLTPLRLEDQVGLLPLYVGILGMEKAA